MNWFQKIITIRPKSRGIHIITDEIVQQLPELADYATGLGHIFIRHTSASLAINENADPTVRIDLEQAINSIAPENPSIYLHSYEGPDDMPAHIKAVLIGPSLTIPIKNGRFSLGTWQGIYLCEHRDRATPRQIEITLNGQLL